MNWSSKVFIRSGYRSTQLRFDETKAYLGLELATLIIKFNELKIYCRNTLFLEMQVLGW